MYSFRRSLPKLIVSFLTIHNEKIDLIQISIFTYISAIKKTFLLKYVFYDAREHHPQ